LEHSRSTGLLEHAARENLVLFGGWRIRRERMRSIMPMKQNSIGLLTAAVYADVAERYWRRWGVRVCGVDLDGRVLLGEVEGPASVHCQETRRLAISEALRWGEPTVDVCPCTRWLWALPLTENNELRGGLVAQVWEERVFGGATGQPQLDVRRACSHLRELGEEMNLTNQALLEARRTQYRREQVLAEAIHEYKRQGAYDIRGMYLREEPALLAAIRAGDRQNARGILNRILVAVHHQTGERIDLTKSFFMELVTTMCRTAVEAGGQAEALLGHNYASVVELSRLTTFDELASWLTDMLERILASIEQTTRRGGQGQIAAAVDYMRNHYTEDIKREEVASEAGLSASHFSRLFKKQMGRQFQDVLNQMRVDRACELLARTEKELAVVALDAGFRDQSYFHKVFHRYVGCTPKIYRQNNVRPSADNT
jgi:AraC-like DNA-binding protein